MLLYIQDNKAKKKARERDLFTLEKAASRAKKTPAEAAVAAVVERVASARSKVPAPAAAISDG